MLLIILVTAMQKYVFFRKMWSRGCKLSRNDISLFENLRTGQEGGSQIN
jgi:hypothetical protein